MYESGRYSAREFEGTHPAEYRSMPYSRIDCHLRPALSYLDFFAWPIACRLVATEPYWIETKYLPFWEKSKLAQMIYGLHYLHGTAEASKC